MPGLLRLQKILILYCQMDYYCQNLILKKYDLKIMNSNILENEVINNSKKKKMLKKILYDPIIA